MADTVKLPKDSRLTIKITVSSDAPIQKVQEMGEMLDLQKESVNISNAEKEIKNKTLYQYLVKVLPNDEVELIKAQSDVDGC